MNFKLITEKPFIIQERPLTNCPLPKVEIKPCSKQYDFSISDLKDMKSPYGRHVNNDSKNDKSMSSNQNLSKYSSGKIDMKTQLETSQNSNTPIEGWSTEDIIRYRNELQQSLKPEVIEMVKNLKSKRIVKTVDKTQDSQVVSEIRKICNEKVEEPMDVMTTPEPPTDLSFLPIPPENRFVNMNKLEMDKLEWMRYIEKRARDDKLKSIRFHIDGSIVPPDFDADEGSEDAEAERKMFQLDGDKFDPYIDSLNHHGDEPDRRGYTFAELFWLGRSSFAMQKSIAVATLTRVVSRSMRLDHVHLLNEPIIVQTLVDVGLMFLARWLLDDAGKREQYIDAALRLLRAVLVIDFHDDDPNFWNRHEKKIDIFDNRIDSLDMDIDFSDYNQYYSTPGVVPAAQKPMMIAKQARQSQLSRSQLVPSERGDLEDDFLLAEDMLSCLVGRTGLLDRLSYLLVTETLVLGEGAAVPLLDVLGRIAGHSIDTVHALANDNEKLLKTIINRYWLSLVTDTDTSTGGQLVSQSETVSRSIRLVRLLCQASRSVAHKLNRDKSIIKSLHTTLATVPVSSRSTQVHRESLGLVTTLLVQLDTGIDPVVIQSIIQSIDRYKSFSSIYRLALAFVSRTLSSCVSLSKECLKIIDAVAMETMENLIKIDFNSQEALIDHLEVARMIQLVNQYAQYQYRSVHADRSCFDIGSAFRDAIIPVIDRLVPLLMDGINRGLVIGFEHRQSGLELVSRDLTNHLHADSLRMAVKTRNPKFIDRQPFFIDLDPRFPLLSAICRAVSFVAESSRLELLQSDPDAIARIAASLTRLLATVASIPATKISTTSTHSMIVQSQLACVAQAALTVAQLPTNHSTVSMVIVQTAARVVPHLGPALFGLGRLLLSRIVFNPQFNRSVISIPEIESIYHKCLQIDELSIDGCTADHFFLPIDWVDIPFSNRFNFRDSSTGIDLPLQLSPRTVLGCLLFIDFIESQQIVDNHRNHGNNRLVDPFQGIRRLAQLLLQTSDWIFDTETRDVLATLLGRYLSDPASINISRPTSSVTVCKKTMFLNLYQDLLDQYFACSLSDPLLANLVVFPCAMRFPFKYRQALWVTHFDHLRLVTINIAESVFPIQEFLQPEETDNNIVRHYWQALVAGKITEAGSELLYWIAIHHVNRFIFNRELARVSTKSDYLSFIQKGFGHAVSNPEWQRKPFIKHIRLYKHFVSSTVEFYEELPEQREQYISLLNKQYRK